MGKISRQRRTEILKRAQQLRRQGQYEGWPVEQITAALLAELPELLVLEAWRLAYGWSRQQTIDAMTASAGADSLDLGLNPSMLCRWEHGTYRPSPQYASLLCEVYQVNPRQLGLISGNKSADRAHSPPGDSRPAQTPADHGLDLPWRQSGLLKLLGEEAHMLTRRRFAVISGTALTLHAWRLLDEPSPALAAAARDSGHVSQAMVSLVEDTVTRAQQLDDQQGGGSALGWVADQFRAVSRMLRHDSYDAWTGRRLCAALAQLAQTAGFMAHDSGRDGDAQRWYLIGLRAAHTANDHALVASILSLMSNQAAGRRQTNDALQLVSAAEQAAAQSPATVQALIAARSCLAYASAGDLSGFRRSRDQCLTKLALAQQRPYVPRWAGYASPTELDAIAGRGFVILARNIPTRRKSLLSDAEQLLHDRAFTDLEDIHQRSALRHGAWLAIAHAQAGDLPQAINAGRSALSRLPGVTSIGSIKLLRQLRADLTPRAPQEPAIRTFIADLDQQLPAS
ncbi:helix-turn-helix domain-containing protein [Actinomadura sp. HBU206391]|uniref:helix-turn-helix domain-containing protein n=1 Tax=Actinomadura sp. HBU206391 TaxID=2731692 RepID=UPI0016508898|nr:helix-turn-helix transcriptional regulator [Actinomadura sp. HBU206391]MBC6457091.1 helix-turn-helix transcriptional regulator [Actinomadura sp. HBU206391]